jgi:hypothetical protein
MNQLSPEARRLLKLARREDAPDSSVQRRVERSLGRRVALGAAVGAGGTLFTKTAAGARLLALAAKIVGAGSIAAVVGAGWLVTRSAPSEQASEVRTGPDRPLEKRPALSLPAPEVAPQATPAPVVPSARSAGDREPARSAPAPKKVLEPVTAGEAPVAEFAPLPSQAPDRLLAETTDLRRAQQALRAGDPALALRLVREQDQQHAGGVLQQERAAVSIFALCESGQAARARSEAAKFEERWPSSALVGRVRASCQAR